MLDSQAFEGRLLLSFLISSILVTRTSSAVLPTETSMSKNCIWAHLVCVGSCGLWGLTFVWAYLAYWFGLTFIPLIPYHSELLVGVSG